MQVTAHLPLIPLPFSSTSYFVFDIMIQIMAFDLLPPPEEYIDFNFTETEPWNTQFEWLGYDSANFINLMGTILIFATIMIVQGVLVLLQHLIKCNVKCKAINEFLDSTAFKQGVIRFLLETYFELVICSLVGFKMLEVKPVWSDSEYGVFIIQLAVLIISSIFFMVASYFLLWVLPRIIRNKLKKRDEEYRLLKLRMDEAAKALDETKALEQSEQ